MGSSTLSIFISVLCDNLLLTVVVPILPEILRSSGMDLGANGYHHQHPIIHKNVLNTTFQNPQESNWTADGIHSSLNQEHASSGENDAARDCLRRLFHLNMLHENSQLGLLFSTKALVQLFANPFVGSLTFKVGYKIPLCIGNFILFLCSLVFAFANSYGLFVVGRSFHGLASSLISVSGMALVAEAHPVDEERTKFLGRVMGAAALGVLIGYPFGGITFSLFGKLVPFLGIAILSGINVVFQITTQIQKYDVIKALHPEDQTQLLLDEGKAMTMPTTLWSLFKDRSIKIISATIFVSTTSMAILEPTLPVWLMENMNPPKWQLGLVFVPDSLGYFVGTNFFGEISLRIGRWKMSMISLAAIGISSFMLPLAKRIWQLALPHFTLGIGLGIVDASLMPLLARLADEKYHAGYGAVYALAQTSVALAYSLGPLLGGELVPVIGFPDLIRSVGFLNLLICPLMLVLSHSDMNRTADSEIQYQEADLSSSSEDDGALNRRIANARHFNAASFCSPQLGNKTSVKHQQHRQSESMRVANMGEVLPLQSFVHSTPHSFNYQRFHDQLDSD